MGNVLCAGNAFEPTGSQLSATKQRRSRSPDANSLDLCHKVNHHQREVSATVDGESCKGSSPPLPLTPAPSPPSHHTNPESRPGTPCPWLQTGTMGIDPRRTSVTSDSDPESPSKQTSTSPTLPAAVPSPVSPPALAPCCPLPLPKPKPVIYDPQQGRAERYARWSRTRVDSPIILSDDDLPCAPSDVSFTLVTPQPSGKREMGRSVLMLDARRQQDHLDNIHHRDRPQVAPGELWIDGDFGVEVAVGGLAEVEWKRPGEICDQPVLFSDGTSRFDIGQGSAGTCWFLSILTSLADKPEYLSQIIPANAYLLGEPGYDGVFHCCLWKLGNWHDVYIDDYLPVDKSTKKLWGAYSATNPNEMWVALMEKAFARFYGSYAAVKGGCAGDAFVTLTGGVQEDLKLEKISPLLLFSRLDNAIRSGAILACSVPVEQDGQMGLTGGHAYTITGIAQVPYRGKLVPLVRVRNPWGNGQGEWTGPWSDGSPQWTEVSTTVIRQLEYKADSDGEFWISLSDFYMYFWRVFVCNFTPDFDKDGIPNGLDRVWTILGEWEVPPGESEQSELPDMLDGPKYQFCLPESCLINLSDPEGVEVGRCPVVIQFLQENIDNDLLFARCRIFKVASEWQEARGQHLLLDDLTNEQVFVGGQDVTYRYSLEAGSYMIVPSYSSSHLPDEPRSFCLRIFTNDKVNCWPVEWGEQTYVYLSSDQNYYFAENARTIKLENLQYYHCEWVQGLTAGGQACRSTYHTNPQVHLSLPGTSLDEPLPVMVAVSQELRPPVVPLGIDIYRLTREGMAVPLGRKTLRRLDGLERYSLTQTGSFTFIRAPRAGGRYVLPPGEYVLVFFSDGATDEKRFAVTIATAVPFTSV